MTADPTLAFLSIAEAGDRYRSGSLSPVTMAETCLERIAACNDTLNAYTTVLDESAIAEAHTAAVELEAGRYRGPMHGIPIAIKDLVAMAGVPTTFGSDPVFAETPSRDAALVNNLRAAGAVIIGKTQLLEFAYGAVHPDVGQTNNPWNPKLTAGGSSGGSAGAVAAALCSGAVGTDTGGSIRIPAAYCGIVGIKPTYGLVPTDGLSMLSWSLDHAGPMARRCADTAALLGGMVGRPFALGPFDLSSARFGVIAPLRDNEAVTDGVGAAFSELCKSLRAAGSVVEDVTIDHITEAAEAKLHVLAPEAAIIHEERYRCHATSFAKQTRAKLELGFVLPATAYVRAKQFQRYLGSQYLRLLDSYDALLSPTVPWEAPAEEPAFDNDGGGREAMATAPTSLCGLPSVSVPCGFGADELPVGLQITGRPHADAQILAIGAVIEALYPPKAPPGYLP